MRFRPGCCRTQARQTFRWTWSSLCRTRVTPATHRSHEATPVLLARALVGDQERSPILAQGADAQRSRVPHLRTCLLCCLQGTGALGMTEPWTFAQAHDEYTKARSAQRAAEQWIIDCARDY